MEKGDHIYYRGKSGDTIPGKIVAVKKRYKVLLNDLNGNRVAWVDSSQIELQESLFDTLSKKL